MLVASPDVNEKLGELALLGLLGFCVIVTSGGVPSTTTAGSEPERLNDAVSWRSSVAQR